MRLFLVTALVMLAFAANSLLNRAALAEGLAGPTSFAALRLVAGAGVLALLVTLRRRRAGKGAPPLARAGARGAWGALSLATYVLGFSYAYVSLDAGAGALILFGWVQVTMFAGALLAREPVPARRWIGALIAFSGLCYLLWPAGTGAPDLAGAALMTAAALGWGVYSLLGRGAADPLGETARNFLWAAPAGLALLALVPDRMGAAGALLAVLSGAVTSGLGYALWYRVLPRLGASRAAVAQLSVPLIAIAGGAILLGEGLGLRLMLSALLVLGGIALSLRPLNS